MSIIIKLMDSFPYINPPFHLSGWVVFLFMVALLIWLGWKSRERLSLLEKGQWLVFLVFLLFQIIGALFFGIRLTNPHPLSLTEIPVQANIPTIMLFSALPWLLVGGMLGPIYAVILAFLSGILSACWETHSFFTPVEMGLMAILFSNMVRQNYKTRTFAFMRHPFGAAFILVIFSLPILLISAYFSSYGDVAARLDYAFTSSWWVIIPNAIEILLASLCAEALYIIRFKYWGKLGEKVDSPFETSLKFRFAAVTIPILIMTFMILIIGVWLGAVNTARQMVKDRLSSTALVATDSLPYFLETGQNLILSLAEENLLSLEEGQREIVLGEKLRKVPYFTSLMLFDFEGNPVANYPPNRMTDADLTAEERAGITLALRGVTIQTYTVPPMQGGNSAEVSFIAAIARSNGEVAGVLLGRTDLASNPFTQPAISALQTIKNAGGTGLILDENHRVIFHTIPEMVMKDYLGQIPQAGILIDEPSSEGKRQFSYYQPMTGRPWGIILTLPAAETQRSALQIASIPFLALLSAAIIISIMLQVMVGKITKPLQSLSRETARIAQGDFEHKLEITTMDEVGQFARDFEQMRASLRDRLEELNRLLKVSKGVAASLDASSALRPVLEAALGEKACLARIVLFQEASISSNQNRLAAFGIGKSAEAHAYLDGQLFELMKEQRTFTISNTLRLRRLQFVENVSPPGAIIAAGLYRENRYYGVLWVGYEKPYQFSEAEERFLYTLAGQAAMAAANVGLYASAEIGRQRLEAVLHSTPEPVLVIDEQYRLLLLNPAATEIPGLISNPEPGKPIKDVVKVAPLLDFITKPIKDRFYSEEIITDNGRVYFASLSPVLVNNLSVGKVCILQDVTFYKKLDTIKSEFVSTVSHDLRSPLTLIKGYASMLEMVGQLNEQQMNYAKKIITNIDSMSKIVNNLLDLGRIESGIGLKITQIVAKELIETVMHSLEPQATQKNIRMGMNILSPSQVVFHADPDLLQRALFNLLDNAIKFTPVGGSIEIRLRPQNDMLCFEIHDTGIGIAPIDLPHMFEKFYRSGRREAYSLKGTGLGLAIVKSIAERHGGNVRVESTLGKGSIFYLQIPVTPPS